MTMSEDFRKLLHEMRESAGLSFDRLAKAAHLDVAHVHRIETGKRGASRNTVIRLAWGLTRDPMQADRLVRAAGYTSIMGD